MSRIIKNTGIFLIAIMFSSLPLLAQGMFWETTMKTPMMEGQDMISQTFYMPRMLKNISRDEVSIIRLDKEIVYTINTTRKQYSEMTFAQLEAMQKDAGKKLRSQMEEMKKHLENLPPEQRKQMESMMGSQFSGSDEMNIDVKNTGEQKKIAGHACTKSIVTLNGNNFLTAWTATDIPGYESMRKEYTSLSGRMSAFNAEQGKKMAEAMKKLNGFPIQMEIGNDMTMTVTKIEKRTIPMSEFEIPAGYKKVKSLDRKRGSMEFDENEEESEKESEEEPDQEESNK